MHVSESWAEAESRSRSQDSQLIVLNEPDTEFEKDALIKAGLVHPGLFHTRDFTVLSRRIQALHHQ